VSDQGDSEDRTEEPTEKKLREAVEKGDIAHSREAPLFAGLLAALIVCSLVIRDGAIRMADVLGHLLDDPGRWMLHDGADAMALLGLVARAAAAFLVPIFAIFIIAGLAVSFAQALPSFVLDRIAPKLSKISPAAGLGRMFGRTGFVEFVKAVFKLVAIGLVVFLILRSEQTAMADAMFVDPAGVADRILATLVRLLSGVGVAFLLLTAIDLVWTKISWKERMRMSRREVKEELKQAEGDPIVKSKRRSLQLDRSRRRMMADVPRATVIVTNPTHYAIALRYVRAEGGAPIVVAKGQDLVALKIREIAEKNEIAIVENKPLARSMYDHVEVAQAIPPEFYKAVAEIVHYVQSRGAPKTQKRTSRVLP
jgi:flagellar biosynthetic protein FlhB